MANILNHRIIFSQIWMQWKAEAEALGSRSLKLQSIDRSCELRKFENVKGSNIVKYVQKKYFRYIIDKIVSLTNFFLQNFFILSWFLLLFLLLFLLIVYISLAFHLEVFQSELFASLSYKYMKIWYSHGQYKANGLRTNKISYNIFDYLM